MTPILGTMASQISGHLSNPVYESIATVTVGSGGANITFSSIPQTYTHLQIRGILKSNYPSAGPGNIYYNINGDTTQSNYSAHYVRGRGDTATVQADGGGTDYRMGLCSGNGTGLFAPIIVDFLDYKNTNKKKVSRTLTGLDSNGGESYIGLWSSCWQNTAAISTIYIYQAGDVFAQYSSLALYGVK